MCRYGRRESILTVVAYVAIVLSGCRAEVATNPNAVQPPSESAQPASPSEPPTPSTETPAATASPEKTDKEIALEVVDKDGLQKAIDKHRGKVVLVDVWATWCAPCKKLFPHTVELHNKYGEKGLAVISLSMDDADAHEDALAFLMEQDAEFTNLRSKYGADQEAVEAFDIDGGALPHFKLYDRKGKPVKKLISGETTPPPEPEDIDKAVEELLGEK